MFFKIYLCVNITKKSIYTYIYLYNIYIIFSIVWEQVRKMEKDKYCIDLQSLTYCIEV